MAKRCTKRQPMLVRIINQLTIQPLAGHIQHSPGVKMQSKVDQWKSLSSIDSFLKPLKRGAQSLISFSLSSTKFTHAYKIYTSHVTLVRCSTAARSASCAAECARLCRPPAAPTPPAAATLYSTSPLSQSSPRSAWRVLRG